MCDYAASCKREAVVLVDIHFPPDATHDASTLAEVNAQALKTYNRQMSRHAAEMKSLNVEDSFPLAEESPPPPPAPVVDVSRTHPLPPQRLGFCIRHALQLKLEDGPTFPILQAEASLDGDGHAIPAGFVKAGEYTWKVVEANG